MKISLTVDCYVFLLTNVPPDAGSFAALVKARRVDNLSNRDEFLVACSEADARMFLAAARDFFPEGIREVELAINQGVSPDPNVS
jgi:hypothetical protein